MISRLNFPRRFRQMGFDESRLGENFFAKARAQALDQTIELVRGGLRFLIEQENLLIGKPLENRNGQAQTNESFRLKMLPADEVGGPL